MNKESALLIPIILLTCISSTGQKMQNSISSENKNNIISEFIDSFKRDEERLYHFPVKINEKEYRMSFKFDEVMAENWQIEEGQDCLLEGVLGENNSGDVKITNGKDVIHATFKNAGDKALPYSKCRVVSMIFNKDEISKDTKVVFPNNITMDSMKSKVILEYGTENYDSENNLLELSYTESSSIKFYFDDEGKHIKSVEVRGDFI